MNGAVWHQGLDERTGAAGGKRYVARQGCGGAGQRGQGRETAEGGGGIGILSPEFPAVPGIPCPRNSGRLRPALAAYRRRLHRQGPHERRVRYREVDGRAPAGEVASQGRGGAGERGERREAKEGGVMGGRAG